jgi:hypothetical protein
MKGETNLTRRSEEINLSDNHIEQLEVETPPKPNSYPRAMWILLQIAIPAFVQIV